MLIRAIAMSMLAALLVACGGGGGSAGTSSGSGSTGGSSTTTGTTTVVVSTPTVSVSVINSFGSVTNKVSVGASFFARAIVTDADGKPVSGRLVNFTVGDASKVVLGGSTALTNSSGIASVSLSPATVSSTGATVLGASALVSSVSYLGQFDFEVSAGNLTLSPMTAGAINLDSAGNTNLSITALLGGIPTSLPVSVVYKATCGSINGQTSPSGVAVTTNGSGVAPASYASLDTAGNLCSGPVRVDASTAGLTTASSLTLTVAAPIANAISFLSATPSRIFVTGSGALERSEIKFKVFSGASALPNVNVRFSVVTNPLGLGIGSTGSLIPVVVVSNGSGEASVSVFSGTQPGPVRLRAELVSNPTVFAESQNLTVASGPPSQRFMDLSVSVFNIEGWAVSGTNTKLTVRVADRQGNSVEDGTIVNFTSEGGQVASSCSTIRINDISSCSVDFSSQNPRPTGGRVSVLAFLEGTKDYVDLNGNNRYDAGIDTLINQGDAYRDDNENGTYSAISDGFVISRGGATACAGSSAPYPSRLDTCDATLSTTVRQQTTILFSSSEPLIDVTSNEPDLFEAQIRSLNNTLLPMPAGTVVSAEASGGTCSVDKQFGSPVVNVLPGTNPNADLSTTFRATLRTCVPGNTIFVNVTAPGGLKTTQSFRIPSPP